MKAERIEPGDVVRLRTEGPLMTVTTVEDYGATVWAMWFDAAGEVRERDFEAVALVRAESSRVRSQDTSLQGVK